MKTVKNISLMIAVFAMTIVACQKQEDISQVITKKVNFSELLDNLGWVDAETQPVEGRANFCQLGDASPFPCNGGSCEGSTDIDGHDFCVVCVGGDNDGDMGCGGSGYVIQVLDELATFGSDPEIDYDIKDGEGTLIATGSGKLSLELGTITMILANDEKARLSFTIFQ